MVVRSVDFIELNEIASSLAPSAKHSSLLSSYRLNLRRGPKAVSAMIVADIQSSLDLGASKHAADLLIVLRAFLSDYPETLTPMASQSPTSR